MKSVFIVALLGSAVVAAPARAEFQVVLNDSSPMTAEQSASGPIVRAPQSSFRALRPVGPIVVSVAQGFGRQVPLPFAARQIVLAKVKVTFGPGVDPAAVVDWTGGCPWNEALRAAVRSLGLRVAVGWMTVSITRS